MLDALALPTMGLVIVAFLTYIWVAWLKGPSGRSLTVSEDETDDADPEDRFS